MLQTFAVIGLGEFGASLAVELARRGARVVAVDQSPELVERIKDEVVDALTLDATDVEALKSAGIDTVNTAVVAIGANAEAAVLVTALLSNLGIERIIARATSPLQAQILALVGANRVVSLEHEMAERYAATLVTTGVLAGFDLEGGNVMVEFQPPAEFVGRTLAEIDLRRRHDVLVVGFITLSEERTLLGRRRQVRSVILPDPERRIEADDILLVVGQRKKIESLTS